MRHPRRATSFAVLAASVLWAEVPAAATGHKIPLSCSKGPRDQHYSVSTTIPGTAAAASTYTVRIDAASSGKISQVGLNYIHDMSYDYLDPDGTTYVAGSARFVAGTGTANVRTGARVSHDGGVIRVVLPGHVDEGTSYTPPSVELELKVTAAAGTAMVFKFAKYRVTANAVILGDMAVSCDPSPKPYAMGTTTVTAPP